MGHNKIIAVIIMQEEIINMAGKGRSMNEQYSLLTLLGDTEKAANELVGIEHSDEEDTDIIEKPYDPDDIRITPKIFSVSDVCRWMGLGTEPPTITIKPDFQREQVWSLKKKSLLIESLMLRIPIPSFYFYEDENGHKSVIDGLQRLSTIFDYVKERFVLGDLEYLGEKCNGKKFTELEQKYISRINDTQLSVNILDSRTPELVKFDVFTRINTGGVPLNSQEIRNAMASQKTRNLLSEMSKSESFKEATRCLVKDTRMDAQGLCLRFIAFYKAYNKDKKLPQKNRPLSKMLDECIVYLNKCDEKTLYSYSASFESAMSKSIAAFGKRSFTKPGRDIINKSLFTSWAVTLVYSDYSCETLLENQTKLINKLTAEIEKSADYFNAITTSTATRASIDKQFKTAHTILEEIIGAYQS